MNVYIKIQSDYLKFTFYSKLDKIFSSYTYLWQNYFWAKMQGSHR